MQNFNRNANSKQRIAKHTKKHRNNLLIRPQEKQKNYMREIDLKKNFQEVRALVKFPSKSRQDCPFNRNFKG